LLQENAALREAQDALQLQATRLQQQLSSERQSAQVAAAAAAAAVAPAVAVVGCKSEVPRRLACRQCSVQQQQQQQCKAAAAA